MKTMRKAQGLCRVIPRFLRHSIADDEEPKSPQFSKRMGRQWFLGLTGRERRGTNRQMMHLLDL